ncbi:hypothetical protein [Catenuloplanes japonicus]|uniref:hypothetical protein n=1 Tax=Catenuloplanes japonicus TaxID=33876 RepID=UPI000AB9BE80|nr:hypothetical protein [Catenuloplanes japonicus]
MGALTPLHVLFLGSPVLMFLLGVVLAGVQALRSRRRGGVRAGGERQQGVS